MGAITGLLMAGGAIMIAGSLLSSLFSRDRQTQRSPVPTPRIPSPRGPVPTPGTGPGRFKRGAKWTGRQAKGGAKWTYRRGKWMGGKGKPVDKLREEVVRNVEILHSISERIGEIQERTKTSITTFDRLLSNINNNINPLRGAGGNSINSLLNPTLSDESIRRNVKTINQKIKNIKRDLKKLILGFQGEIKSKRGEIDEAVEHLKVINQLKKELKKVKGKIKYGNVVKADVKARKKVVSKKFKKIKGDYKSLNASQKEDIRDKYPAEFRNFLNLMYGFGRNLKKIKSDPDKMEAAEKTIKSSFVTIIENEIGNQKLGSQSIHQVLNAISPSSKISTPLQLPVPPKTTTTAPPTQPTPKQKIPKTQPTQTVALLTSAKTPPIPQLPPAKTPPSHQLPPAKTLVVSNQQKIDEINDFYQELNLDIHDIEISVPPKLSDEYNSLRKEWKDNIWINRMAKIDSLDTTELSSLKKDLKNYEKIINSFIGKVKKKLKTPNIENWDAFLKNLNKETFVALARDKNQRNERFLTKNGLEALRREIEASPEREGKPAKNVLKNITKLLETKNLRKLETIGNSTEKTPIENLGYIPKVMDLWKKMMENYLEFKKVPPLIEQIKNFEREKQQDKSLLTATSKPSLVPLPAVGVDKKRIDELAKKVVLKHRELIGLKNTVKEGLKYIESSIDSTDISQTEQTYETLVSDLENAEKAYKELSGMLSDQKIFDELVKAERIYNNILVDAKKILDDSSKQIELLREKIESKKSTVLKATLRPKPPKEEKDKAISEFAKELTGIETKSTKETIEKLQTGLKMIETNFGPSPTGEAKKKKEYIIERIQELEKKIK